MEYRKKVVGADMAIDEKGRETKTIVEAHLYEIIDKQNEAIEKITEIAVQEKLWRHEAENEAREVGEGMGGDEIDESVYIFRNRIRALLPDSA